MGKIRKRIKEWTRQDDCLVFLGGFMFNWDANLYKRFEKERTIPCYDLVHSLPDHDFQSILDIGCGIGNSTAVLKNEYPSAKIIGADSSGDMLKSAREKNPDCRFISFDFSKDLGKIHERYDLLFSNACIHWIDHHEQLIPDLFHLLKDGGTLAIQIPLQARHPFYQKIDEMCVSTTWKDKINRKKEYYTLKENQYYDILSKLSLNFRIWETSYYHCLDCHEAILEWYRGTGLRSYLDQLTEEDGVLFQNELLQFVKENYPLQEDGTVLFKIPRLFFVISK